MFKIGQSCKHWLFYVVSSYFVTIYINMHQLYMIKIEEKVSIGTNIYNIEKGVNECCVINNNYNWQKNVKTIFIYKSMFNLRYYTC